MFARLMGGMLFPSVEGVREAGRIMHELGMLSARPNPYDHLDLGPVARLEGAGAFGRIMGLTA
jgi:hypothetical protein